MPPWTDPLWLAEAHGWIKEQVGRVGASVVGAIEQPPIRPWSTVMPFARAGSDLTAAAVLTSRLGCVDGHP